MKITKRQLRRIIKEEKRKVILEQGDPIADVLLGDFVTDLVTQLIGMYEPKDAHRIGTPDEFEAQVVSLTGEIESMVRSRLGDLWSGDIKLELLG
jgi:predicted Holliday junction resolvase-like endonuclease